MSVQRRMERVGSPAQQLWAPVLARLESGDRFAGLVAAAVPDGTRLTALLAGPRSVDPVDVVVGSDSAGFPSLTDVVPPAFWYERAIRDLHGLDPLGHPRPQPLVLPLRPEAPHPRPGLPGLPVSLLPDEHVLPTHVDGLGLFSVPFGPVRSGVTESVEYLVETPGEDIPHLHVRVFAKHRGVQSRFSRLRIADGVLLSERVEGIASVAHALAFCQAAERATGTAVGEGARLTRVVHAELERVVNHVDVAMRLCDAAGLGVGTARMGWHKERLQRLVSRLCHSRFGRGVVVPGGVTAFPALSGEEIVASVASVRDDLLRDATVLMRTASFLDRLRGTGPLTYDEARALAALGPVGRASGYDDDDRVHRPYAAYDVVVPQRVVRREGDAQARLQVRWGEVEDSFRLLREAALALEPHRSETAAVPVPHVDGRAVGWAEAPQGEVLYDVEVASGRVVRAAARSASMHNLAIFSTVFRGDIFTDFPFIEASFGVSIAGVVM